MVFLIFLLKNCSVPNKLLTVGESGRSMWNTTPSVGKNPQCGHRQVLLEVSAVHSCSECAFGVLNSFWAPCRASDFWQGWWWDAVGIGKFFWKSCNLQYCVSVLMRGRMGVLLAGSFRICFFPGPGVRDAEVLLRDKGEHCLVGRRK